MNTLHLNLHGKWFDMVLSGEKPDEYRALTEYWVKRLIDWSEYPKEQKDDTKNFAEDIIYDLTVNKHPFDEVLKGYFAKEKHYDTITFSNGYSKKKTTIYN